MALISEPVEETKLNHLDDVTTWINDSQGHVNRLPVAGVLNNHAEFLDDEYLGDGETMLRFNEVGIRAFCQYIGFRHDQLAKLETPSLASQIMNDLIRQRDVREKLGEADFVLDDRTGTILGIVSESYVSYDNARFLAEISELLDTVKEGDKFEFQEGYTVNTELTLRFSSIKHHGEIQGRGGQGADRTRLGLEFQNSMVGSCSVQINYFLHRLACANGMMVPAGGAISRVIHSGNRDTFQKRLGHRFQEMVRKLGTLDEMLKTLGAMAFVPKTLVADSEANKLLFEVIPATKQTICREEGLQLVYPKEATDTEKKQLRLEHDARIAALIPKHFGGEHSRKVFLSFCRDSATIFDLINVFTEQAKALPPSQKLAVEGRAGALAKYISENKKKL